MTREEWQRIKQVSMDALEHPEADRPAYVSRVCDGDASLEREVLSLIASVEHASDLFENASLATRRALTPGVQLGPYEVLGPIGAGSMGEVYRAQDHRLGREVAIKVLPVVFTADPDRVRRFEQEAKATGALNHPNVLTIYDIGSDGGAPYVISELLEGETLRERLARLMPIEAAVEFARQVAEGLAAAHAKGIVHRDLKPENLFVTRDDRIKILDFGLAKLMAGAGAAPGEGTQPGTVMGTAGYMAPEQVRGGHVDHRSDLFALGTILYEMLAGRRAFDAPSPVETMHAIVAEQPVKLPEARPAVSDRLAAVVRAFGRHSSGLAAVALALSGAVDEASELGDRLHETYPVDTLLNNVWLTCARALIASQRGKPQDGLEILRAAVPYELGWTSYYLPSYVRGLLYLQARDGANARAQFQNILDHQGVMPVSPLYSLASLQIGRAAALSEDAAASRGAYERFFSTWKSSDAGHPLVARARTEYQQIVRRSPE
jgi:serine/threonine protein kinase